MLSGKSLLMAAATVVVALGSWNFALAQDVTPSGTGGRGNRGARGGGNFDPAQMQQRRDQAIKDAIGATDDEWKVLQPKIDKVSTAQRDMRSGGMGGMLGGRGGRGGCGGRGGAPAAGGADNAPAADAPAQSAVQKASNALGKILENKDAKPDDLKPALAALRDAKAKDKAELEKAQKELKDVLTLRQEAVLVMRGMLD